MCTGEFSLVILVLIVAALIGGDWLGTRRKEESEAAVPDGGALSPAETEETAVPVPCVKKDRFAGAEVSSHLYHFDTLSQLSIAGCWQLKLECNASENYCRVTTENSLLEFVKVEHVRGGLLIRYTGKKQPSLPMTIEIKTKSLPEQVKGTGPNSIVIENARGNNFTCKIADRCRLLISDGELDEFKLKVTGSSQADCRAASSRADLKITDASSAEYPGKIRRLDAEVAGASKLSVAAAQRAELQVSGASRVKIEASEKLSGDVSGSSTVKYSGPVENVDFRTSNSSRVKRG